MRFKINRRERLPACLMLAVGLVTMAGGQTYETGTLARMGPGFYPVMLGALLSLVSMLVLLSPAPAEDAAPAESRPKPEYRAWACVIGGVLAFMLLGTYTGLVPATFALVFVSAMGERRNDWKTAAALAVGMSAVAVLVFSLLLKMQFPLFFRG